MKFCIRSLILFVLPAAVWAQTAALPKVTMWPGNRKAAVSLTFDDALMSQLHNAAPVLKKYHLHGTFFVITGSKRWLDHIDEWRQLEAEGNEIGSHTVHHPCMYPTIKPNSRDYTPAMMKAELRDSAQAIVAALGTHRGLTFNYPCGDLTFGPPWDAERNQLLYFSYVAKYYFAARLDTAGSANDPLELDPLTISARSEARVHFPQMLAMLKPVVSSRQWGVYIFHGVGGDYLQTNLEVFDKFCAYLHEHPEIWTTTFGNAVRYILERRALKINATQSGERKAEFSLNWPMNPEIYDLPLTLTWALPQGWTSYRAEADGHPLASKVLTESGHKMAFVNVAPQTKVLLFERQ